RPVDRRRGVTVARLTSTTTPEPETIGAASPSLVRPRPTPPAPQPLAGVTCPLLTAAIRRAEERWVSDHAAADDPDDIPRVLAAIGLAVDRRFPSYLLSLEPRPPRLVTQRLLAFVQSELLRFWSNASPTSPRSSSARSWGAPMGWTSWCRSCTTCAPRSPRSCSSRRR